MGLPNDGRTLAAGAGAGAGVRCSGARYRTKVKKGTTPSGC
jgi:hypothetical protein